MACFDFLRRAFTAQCLELLKESIVKLIVKAGPAGKPTASSSSRPASGRATLSQGKPANGSPPKSFTEQLAEEVALGVSKVKRVASKMEKQALSLAADMSSDFKDLIQGGNDGLIKGSNDSDDEATPSNRMAEIHAKDPFDDDDENETSMRRIAKRDVTSICEVTLDRKALATPGEDDVADVPLGFELTLSATADGKNLEAFIKSVSSTGLAVHKLGLDGLVPGDQVMQVNGKELINLPNGPSGRIYLFRMLAAEEVHLVLAVSRSVQGVEDIVTGEFFPTETGSGADLLAQSE